MRTIAILVAALLGALAPQARGADWPTYGGSAARTGVASSPAFSSLHRAWTAKVDGAVYAQPLIAAGRVYVATENNSVYAFSTGGRRLWRRHLGAPVAGSSLPCGNIDPSGITATPAIDARRHRLFALAFRSGHRHELFALDTRSGRVRLHRSADPPGMNPAVQQERGALLLAHGRVYIPYGGLFGDCGSYHGWVVSRTESGSGLRSYHTRASLSAIWATPGPVLDPSGNLLVATGNGTGGFGDQSSVVRLSPTLKRLAFWAPRDWSQLSASDSDVGSISPLPVAGGQILQSGKNGVAYLLPQRLGGIGGELTSTRVCGGAFGATAYRAPLAYLPCNDGLVALRIQPGHLSVAWRASGIDAGPPVVAGGVAWTIDQGGRLHGFDQSSGREVAGTSLGDPITSFPSPAVSGGLMVAPAGRAVVGLRGI